MASESEYDASESEYESSESDYDTPPEIPDEFDPPAPVQTELAPPEASDLSEPAAESEPGLVIGDGSEAALRSEYAATIREAMESAATLRRAMQSAAAVFRAGSELTRSSESADPAREGSESPTISELAAAIQVAMESIVAVRGEAESVANPDSGTGSVSPVSELTAAIREALAGVSEDSVASSESSMVRLQQFLLSSSQTRGMRFFPILVARIGSPPAAAEVTADAAAEVTTDAAAEITADAAAEVNTDAAGEVTADAAGEVTADADSVTESLTADRVLVINPIGRSFVVLQGEAAQLLMQGSGGRPGTQPASKAAIEALRVVENEELEEEMECPVCMDEFGEKKVVKEMPCKHLFHEGCIEKWLRIKGSCPVCRFQMAADGGSDGGEEHGRGIGMTVTEQGVSMSLAMVASVRREESNGDE